MMNRFLLLAALVSTSLTAAPLTIVFTGTATGTLGATAFTNQPFTITFNSDTASVTKGTTCCVNDYTTPVGTTATFSMGTGGSGSFTDDQAVFVNQAEQTLGIWHHNSPDYLTIGHPSFATYTESSSIGPISGTTSVPQGVRGINSSKGVLILTSVSGVSVNITVGTGAPKTPIIASATASYSTGLAPNTWFTIKGDNLVPEGTSPLGATWTGSASFASGNMPDSLNGVTVTFNGKRGYVAFYCSGAVVASLCTKDQINVLTPLDATAGPVQIVVSNGSLSSSATTVTRAAVAPSLFLFKEDQKFVTATHADYSLLGPLTLYPGFSTPASVGETIVLWTSGFGLPKDALVEGSNTQSSQLATLPVCQVNAAPATVAFAGVISPGLYQINLVIPSGAKNGDNSIKCTAGGVSTQDGFVVTVAR